MGCSALPLGRATCNRPRIHTVQSSPIPAAWARGSSLPNLRAARDIDTHLSRSQLQLQQLQLQLQLVRPQLLRLQLVQVLGLRGPPGLAPRPTLLALAPPLARALLRLVPAQQPRLFRRGLLGVRVLLHGRGPHHAVTCQVSPAYNESLSMTLAGYLSSTT